MALFMETTKISAKSTAQEIATILAEAGATAVLTEYDRDRKICGLAFRLMVGEKQVPFTLPARIPPVFTYLQKKRPAKWRVKRAQADLEQAERVAWRQLYRWILAQLAMIDTGMVAAQEVFLPYLQTGPKETLYDRMTAGGRLALPSIGQADGHLEDR